MNWARKVWPTLALGLMSALAAFVLLGGLNEVAAQESRLVWAQIRGVPVGVNLEDVFMTNEVTAYAVGSDGSAGVVYLLANYGDGWQAARQETFRAPLRSVVAVSLLNIWVVGDNGLVAHFDGSTWREASNPVPGANLLTLQMLGEGQEGWAAGYTPGLQETVLLHYKDGRWSRDDSVKMPGRITGLHFAQGAGWLVGSDQVGIWRNSGGAWAREDLPVPCEVAGQCYESFSAVRAISADEAWAVGTRAGTCGICRANAYALHRVDGSWRKVLPDEAIVGDSTPPGSAYFLHGVTFTGPDNGFAVGVRNVSNPPPAADRPLLLVYAGGRWLFVNSPVEVGALTAVSAVDITHALAVGTGGTILSFGYGPNPSASPTPAITPGLGLTPSPQATRNPTERVADPRDPDVTYFAAVGHTLRGPFRDYWQKYGGLPQFGYPLTEEYIEVSATDGKEYSVQYFERARFEHHPENRPPYDVLLGLLGNTVTAGRKGEAAFRRTRQRLEPNVAYFAETGHNMPAEFVDYWRSNGGLPVYGYPISEAFLEISPTDGKQYLVQYYERNRLEYHPELPQPYRVSLGLLGVEVLKARGWIK